MHARKLSFGLTLVAFALGACSDGGDGGGGSENGGGTGGSGAAGVGGGAGLGTGGTTGGTSGASTGGTSGASASGGSAAGGTNAGAGNGGGLTGGTGGGGTGAGGGGTGAGGAGAGGGGTTTLGPRFIGRFTSDHRFAWSGATVALRFTGTSVSVTLTDGGDNFYDAVIDGGMPRVINAESGMRTYEIATGLADGPHEVRVTRRTEAFFNPSTFVSFSVPESSWLPSSAPERRLEIVGDSISAGYGIEGAGPNCGFTADTENHSLTYGALAAKQLGADLHTEAWSGIGIYRNNDDTMTNVMPTRFPRILPDDAGTPWDFSKYQPHAVVVNLGTNDFAGDSDPGMGFQTAQENFAASLREHYPNAQIYLAVGPMLSGTQFSAARTYLEGAVAARQADGDQKIDVIEFATSMASEGFGCDYHPNEAINERMATTLVARLRADLGW
ncbi:MAG TPA: SGNH/GDSL hydrolase family protein [Polyangiaceae bacterium]|nr:SGNH/GDSL hydrolase family protein [Polyangiaceae bacterium]